MAGKADPIVGLLEEESVVMIAIDRTPVRVKGERLHPIWWRGKQWAVTEYGIERLDGSYHLPAHRLREVQPAWVEHVGKKIGVDLDDFTTAFMVALLLHEDKETLHWIMKQHLKLEPAEIG